MLLTQALTLNKLLHLSSLDPLNNSGLTLPAANSAVPTIYDKFGNPLNASQGTGGSQALWVPNGYNTKPVLQFDASNDFYTVNLDISRSVRKAITIFAVYIITSANANQALLGQDNANYDRFVLIGSGAAYVSNGTPSPFFASGLGATGVRIAIALQWDRGEPNGSELWINKVSQGTFTEAAGDAGTTSLYIGRIGSTPGYYAGIKLMEFLIFDGVCPQWQRDFVNDYLLEITQ